MTLTRAKKLRKEMTPAERILWNHLRDSSLGVKFRRQHAKEQRKYDARRTAFLRASGYRVLRLWNDDILKNIEGAFTLLREAVSAFDLSLATLDL